MSVAIVIPTWNNLLYLEQCILSIRDLTLYPYRIVVVCNGCTDGTAEWCKPKSIETIELSENRGFAGGVNAAIPSLLPGEDLLILNDDTRIVDPGWLSRMARHFGDDDTIGAVGPLSNAVVGSQKFELIGLPIIHSAPMLCGFCLLVRSEAIPSIYPLDEDYGPAGTDDMWMHLRAAGYKLVVDRSVFVFHWGEKTSSRIEKDPVDLMMTFDKKWGDGAMMRAFDELDDLCVPASSRLVTIQRHP